MSSTTTAGNHYIHWIHCNRCYNAFIKKERKFFLLACQHINCESCHIEIKQDSNGPPVYKCSVCQKITRGCEINNTMPNNLKMLLHPEPYLDDLNYSLILKFQAVHRRQYLEYLEKRENAIKRDYETALKCKELCKKSYLDLKQQVVRNKQIKKRALAIRLQQRNIDDNRPNKSVSVPSLNYSATSSKRAQNNQSSPTHKSHKAITTFSNLTPKTTFSL